MVTYKERKQRFYEEFKDSDEIYAYLRENFSGQKRVKLKYDIEEREVFINEFLDFNKHLMLVADESYEPTSGNIIIIYG